MVEILTQKRFLRLALRVLSRRRKDNGIPAEDDLDGWPKTIPRTSLDHFLQDQSVVGSAISVDQYNDFYGGDLRLWQFLQEHLSGEKRVVPFVDERFCDVLMKKVLNFAALVNGLGGAALSAGRSTCSGADLNEFAAWRQPISRSTPIPMSLRPWSDL